MSRDECSDGAADSDVPLERLEVEIISWSGNLAAATARLLGWISEYDRREGWKTWGVQSCSQWLSWKCGDSLHTARERVRVARALDSLPATAAAFTLGELSYSKVRAITRVACAGDDGDWVEIARHSTGAQLDRMVAGVKRAHGADEAHDARAAFQRRGVTTDDRDGGDGGDGGETIVTARLPDDMSATVQAALEVIATRMIDEATAGSGRSRREVIAERGGMSAIHADALVQMAEQVLAGGPAAAERGDIGRLQLVVDAENLADVENLADTGECTLRGHRIAPTVARRWACDIRASVVVDHNGHGCDEGRQSRVLNRRLRRAVHRRDHGMCRFPGCGTTIWLHAHHIVHWADGGPTDLANLVSLCGFHHRQIHEGGWNLAIVDREITWSDPEGIPVSVEPLRGNADLLTEHRSKIGIRPTAIESTRQNDRLDLAFVVAVMFDRSQRCRRHTILDVPAGTSRIKAAVG